MARNMFEINTYPQSFRMTGKETGKFIFEILSTGSISKMYNLSLLL
jgi:hypothetical protein